MTFPSARHVALAIVTAARLTGENPLEVVGGGIRSRARNLAMEALMLAFPEMPKMAVARCCGCPHPKAAGTYIEQAHRARWWREDHVDEVLGAVVADQYGERAA